MNCNCMWTELVLAVLILVFAIWPTQIFSSVVSGWIIVAAALFLVIHSLICKKCGGVCAGMIKSKSKKKK